MKPLDFNETTNTQNHRELAPQEIPALLLDQNEFKPNEIYDEGSWEDCFNCM